MPRGELVGDAFIRITADTTAMRRALKREAALAEAEGTSAGAGYSSAFGKEVEKRADQDLAGARKKIRTALTEALVSGDFSEFERSLGGVEQASARIRAELTRLRETNQLNAKEFEVFNNQVEKWAKSALIEERAKKDAEALQALHTEALKLNTVWDNNASAQKRAFAAMQAEAMRMNRTFDVQANARARADAKAWNDMLVEARRMNVEFDRLNKERTRAAVKAWADMVTEAKQLNATFDRNQRASAAATKKAWNDMRVEAVRMNKEFDRVNIANAFKDATREADAFNAKLRDSGTVLFGMDRNIKSVSVSMAKIREGARGAEAFIVKTGRGARDLDRDTGRARRSADGLFSVFGGLNKTLEGISHRGNPLVDLLVAPLRAGTALGKVFDQIFLKSFGKFAGGSPALGGLVSIGSAAAAAVVAILAMIKTASLLASALSLVAGAAIVAASAIGGALVGALLAAAAAVPAVLAGLGGMVLFIKDFSKQAPKSVEALKQFGIAFQKAFDTTAFKGIDRKVGILLDALRPMALKLAKDLGSTFAGIATGIVQSFTNPAVKKSLGTILDAIPHQVALLGSALTNLTTGLIGFFAPIMPFATTLLKAFDDLFISFSRWANSATGQESIVDFMDTAFTMARSLWQTIVNIGRAIGSLFTAASSGPAQDFLGFLEHISGKFADFLASTQGQNELKQWFADVKLAAQGLGELIMGIATVFDHLDTAKGREQIAGALDTVGRWLQQSGPMIDAALGFVDALTSKLGTVNLKPFGDLLALIGNFVTEVAGALKGDALNVLDTKLEGFNELAASIRDDLIPSLKDAMVWLKPLAEFLGGSILKNLASSFKGVADIIAGLSESMAGFLDIITGIVTLDVSKIGEGFRKEFEGSGKILAGAFNAGTGPVKGIIDQFAGTTSNAFEGMQTDAAAAGSSISDSISSGFTSATEATSSFFDDLGKSFEDTRLSIGQWFDDTFSAPDIDFSAVGEKIADLGTSIADGFTTARLATGQFFTDLGSSISEGFTSGRLSIGQFFTDLGTSISEGFSKAMESVAGFFTDLPDKIVFWLGQAAGSIVNFFYEQITAVQKQFEETFIPFITGLPEQLGALWDQADKFVSQFFIDQYDAVVEWWNTVFFPWFSSIPETLSTLWDNANQIVSQFFIDQFNSVLAWWNETFVPWWTSIPEMLGSLWESTGDVVGQWFITQWENLVDWWNTTAQPWFASLPDLVRNEFMIRINGLRDWVVSLWDNALGYLQGTVIPWFRELPNVIRNAFMERVNGLKDWGVALWTNFTTWWEGTAMPWFRELPGRIGQFFVNIGRTVGSYIADALKGTLNDIIRNINNFIAGFNDTSPFDLPFISYLAKGGLVDHATMAVIGESGREAVVPLDRPLSQVDESVRWLAAIAQGKTHYASGGIAGGGKTITIAPGAINVQPVNADPMQVASAVLDRMAVGAFI